MKCPAIGCENGEVWTECCNGSSGCPCKGQQVLFGTCSVCGGSGSLASGTDVDVQENLKRLRGAAAASGGYLGNPHGRPR